MAYITGTGLYHPEHALSNEQLVGLLNAYAERFNAAYAKAIAAGDVSAIAPSNSDFI